MWLRSNPLAGEVPPDRAYVALPLLRLIVSAVTVHGAVSVVVAVSVVEVADVSEVGLYR
jgi:hypothetical protein